MAEKYDRNPEIPAHKDAAKKTYFIKKEKVFFYIRKKFFNVLILLIFK